MTNNHPQLVCGICGSEVRQEGFFLKCQNEDCRMEIPIDTAAVREALELDARERALQSPQP